MKKAVKESWDAGVFMVFLIIDKQRGAESILDVRTPGNVFWIVIVVLGLVRPSTLPIPSKFLIAPLLV